MSASSRQQGSALVIALLLTSLVAALGLGLLSLVDTERAIAANHRDGLQAVYAAEAGLEWAVSDLRGRPDWTPVLAGLQSAFVDATLTPVLASGRTIDLAAETAALQATTSAWAALGANDPQWRLFGFGGLDALTGRGSPGQPAASYLVVWVADDRGETDADPAVDANGRVQVLARAYGPGPTVRTVSALLEKPAAGQPGVRVLTWRFDP